MTALDDTTRDRLRDLGYSDAQIAETTPSIAEEILKAAVLKVSVARFMSLNTSAVSEHIHVPWSSWLAWLAAEPANGFETDHGGWSPVLFDPPKRSKENVRRVFAIVLDHDKGGDWDKLRALWSDHFGLIYTTKSHGAPGTTGDRLRVVLPLNRPVTADEHARIWDWAAERSLEAGCPADTQCRDASRFWYDPSLPPGGWKSERLTGKPIDGDAVLAIVSPPKLRVVRAATPMTSDQRVQRASKYLAKIPGAVTGDGGHTQTFNAVAHVMIGFDLDEATTEQLITDEYNPRCDPPWKPREIQHKIQSVAKSCNRQRGYLLTDRPRIESSRAAATFAPEIPVEVDVDWWSQLLKKKDQTPRRAYYNTAVFVRHHPDYRGKWSIDTMTATPWFNGETLKDTLVHEIRAAADQRLGYTPGREDVEAAILTAAQDRPFHPILQYLRSLDWDGTHRLSQMARDYLGSDSDLHAQMLRKFMIGAAARAMHPGAKLDTALMLVGAQGIGKSTFFSILGGDWHADSFVDITNKDSFVQIHSAWIYELAELENVVGGRAESRLKAWLTSTHDMFRAPYARVASRRARAVVICGTTNKTQFLTDDSGSRRFWIVPVGQVIDREELARCRDQLWAEAVCCAEAGEPWWLSTDMDALRAAANRQHEQDEAWAGPIADFVSPPSVKETTITQILVDALKIDLGRVNRWDQMRVAGVLDDLGWKKIREARPPRRWKYIRPDAQTETPS